MGATKTARCLSCKIKYTYKSNNAKGKYCSNKCQQRYQSYKKILDGNASALIIKRFLKEIYGEQCKLCGWKEVNKTSGKCPIEIDHIDGNSNNNIIENCRLLCPNCHSLTSTYKALNKGSGRKNRK